MPRLIIILATFVFGFWWLPLAPVWADRVEDLQKQINDLEQKVSAARSRERTLSSEIDIITNKISITRLEIEKNEAKLGRLNTDIASLSGKIVILEDSLLHASEVLANRIAQTYKTGRDEPLVYLLSSSDFADFWQRFEYLRIVQKRDKVRMVQMATTRKNYRDQKDILEDKKQEVEVLSTKLKVDRAKLDAQNREKQALLDVTRNDERRYQALLDEARRELEGIRTSQFTGKREVKKGETIGLMGNTGFSFGAHLHFGVYSLSESQAESFNYNSGANNPLDYLKSQNLGMDRDACFDHGSGGSFGTGSWDWPMSSPKISQCYGRTAFSWIYNNGLHMGLDLYDNNDIVIRAVDDGVAYFYRGTSSFGNNVRVFHPDGKMTLYLHMQ